MDNTFVNARKAGRGKDDSLDSLSDTELSGDNGLDCSELKSRRLVRRVNSQRSLILSVKQLLTRNSFIKNSFFQSSRGLDTKIPKHMVTLDERYLRRCLELIHISASKAAQCNISVNLGSAEMGILWDDMNQATIRNGNVCDLGRFVSESPLSAETGSLVISPAGQWIVGSIMCSQSMINILKSPLLNKFGALDGDGNFRRINLNDVKGSINYDYMSSPGGLSSNSSQKQEKETLMLGNHKHGFDTDHKRIFAVSSSNSTCSDQSSSSAFAGTSMGMLQCLWKGGNPHFVFSIDDRKEVYVANLSKLDSIDDKALDYMYSFHWRKSGHKELEIHDSESLLVGKMKVSTSFTLCPNNSKIMQTECTLFGSSEDFVGEMQTSSYDLRKNKGLSKKVGKMFRTSNSSKQRSSSKFGGSSAILENSFWEPSQNVGNNSDQLGGSSLFEDHLPPNLELAAIVVKDHLPDFHQKEVGGWGMKFLKKANVKKSVETLKTSVTSACCSRDTGDCSTSMDVIIPAGFHGGPRTRNGGPSGLIERWRSGGYCDCGGWDLGCPLTILNTRLNKKGFLPQVDVDDECKSIGFFIQGSEHAAPTLRMVNVHDGLYIIHFQSTLSALQSFAIAVASIHSQSPTLRPKNVHEFN
ncbi:hypothetical protein JRO89_XS03G0083700 [Xanthoceras sorbifolium]|uniref:Uncharacterized protein n=1 Tax=Xanthoceras sorbifolium TaxID=99658 RepID=A0ABQ8I9F2_9ROSI|nr:hypothetical protein JRO89_XS03G0083700 [Xanthoceras sorbifolium]